MKTSIQNLFTAALVAICLSSSAFTANASEVTGHQVTLNIPASSIQKVIVKGNVKVLLVQSEKESVRIYETYNSDKTSVKMEGSSLMINSTEDEPIHITVFVKNPFRIEASNTALVQTKGKFNIQFLQVILNDKAKAEVNACTKGLYTLVRDNAKLTLSGTSDEHILIRSRLSTLQMESFACLKTNDTFSENALAKDTTRRATIAAIPTQGK